MAFLFGEVLVRLDIPLDKAKTSLLNRQALTRNCHAIVWSSGVINALRVDGNGVFLQEDRKPFPMPRINPFPFGLLIDKASRIDVYQGPPDPAFILITTACSINGFIFKREGAGRQYRLLSGWLMDETSVNDTVEDFYIFDSSLECLEHSLKVCITETEQAKLLKDFV